MATKRLRIFAGPNGSGKSTLLKVVSDKGIHLGRFRTGLVSIICIG